MKRFPKVMNELNKTGFKRVGAFVFCAAALAMASAPAGARELNPEISSRVWVENDNELAAVSVDGKDLITFRARAGSGEASDEADELAAHLQDVVSDKNFDASQLLPARNGDKAGVRVGQNVIAFAPVGSKNCLDASVQVVNGLRAAMGASPLPANLPDLSEKNTIASGSHGFSGKASWYGPQFHGRKTSDGHRFDMNGLTAAHRSLPFGTKLLVMNRKTGASCVVEVNDRGPFIGNRVLDLSRGAAQRLNMLGSGVAMVDCFVIGSN